MSLRNSKPRVEIMETQPKVAPSFTKIIPLSEHATDLQTSLEIIPHNLPPKALKPWSRRFKITNHAIALLIMLMTTVAVVCYGAIAYRNTKTQLISNFTDDYCDRQAASASEQPFVIDIRFGGGFSFAQAKLIDLAWDMVIGQGGRIFHGWVLYQYVVSPSLVWVMENEAVPFHYFTNLTFSTVSFWSLWSMFRVIFQKAQWRATTVSIWITFAVLYVLLFPTIWSAATGYLSPSTRKYQMPDLSLVSLDSGSLSLCWYLDDVRLGFQDGFVVMGPTLGEIYYGRKDLLKNGVEKHFSSSTIDVWWSLQFGQSPIEEEKPFDAYMNFREVHAYANTIRDIQFFLNSTGAAVSFYDTTLSGSAIEDSYSMRDDGKRTDTGLVGSIISSDVPINGIPRVLYGWQYHGSSDVKAEYPAVNRVSSFSWDLEPYNTTFRLDETITTGPGVVPYKSTFRFNRETYHLAAPFMVLGKICAPHNNFFTSLGSCVCYRNQPLNYDWFNNDNMYCVGKRGYVWGFSSVLTLIGLVLEAIWVLGCWLLWLQSQLNSKILKAGRASEGILRSVLDLAEAISQNVGNTHNGYSEQELQSKLKICDSIQYSVWERLDFLHVGITSRAARGISRLAVGKLYG